MVSVRFAVPLKRAGEKDAKVPIRAKILSSLGNKKQGGIENNGAINDSSKSGCNAYIVWKAREGLRKGREEGQHTKVLAGIL